MRKEGKIKVSNSWFNVTNKLFIHLYPFVRLKDNFVSILIIFIIHILMEG